MKLLFVILITASVSAVVALPTTRLPTPQVQQVQPRQPQLQPQQPIQYRPRAQDDPFTNATQRIILNLRQELITRQMKFDEHFRKLLQESKMNLHKMFSDTYGIMYEQNAEIFTNMYDNLNSYYLRGDVHITKAMTNFFQRLYQKIFQVVNQPKLFSQDYLQCVGEHLSHLKPFKDAPDNLIKDIKHTLVAARALNQAFNTAIDIIMNILTLGDPPQCVKLINDKLLKNQHSPLGVTTREMPNSPAGRQTKPCQGFCEQVIVRCIGQSNLEPLDSRWKSYIGALADLAKKLSGQYNIETSLSPIDVQISEAIMNFQENSHNLTDQIYAACGNVAPAQRLSGSMQPRGFAGGNQLGKREANPVARISPSSSSLLNSGELPGNSNQNYFTRRTTSSPTTASDFRLHSLSGNANGPYDRQRPPQGPVGNHHNTQDSFSSLTEHSVGLYSHDEFEVPGSSPLISFNKRSPIIIGEIREHLLSIRNFWSLLPSSVCNQSLATFSLQPSSVGRRNGAQNCYQEPWGVNEFNSDIRYRNEILQQVAKLEAMQTNINSALHGIEINWSKSSPAPPPILSLPSTPQVFHQDSSTAGQIQQRPTMQPQTTASTPMDDQESEEPSDECEGSGEGELREGDVDECPTEGSTAEEQPEMSTEDTEDPLDEETSSVTMSPTFDITSDDLTTPLEGNDLEGKSPNDPGNLYEEKIVRPKSSASWSGSMFVIDGASLLLVSILSCALSVVIQNQFRPMALPSWGLSTLTST